MTESPHAQPDRDDLARRIWRWYALASLAAALIPGFALGAGIFLARIVETSPGAWQVAAGSAHGHAQIFGWAGLLVLGVAFHFLPRLAGTRLTHPRLGVIALGLLCAGIFGQMIVQPLGAETAGNPSHAILVLLALAELAGAVLAIGLIGRSLSQSGTRATSGAMLPVLPFLVVTALGHVSSLALNVVRFVEAGAIPASRLAGDLDQAILLIAFYGFLLPISVGMSVRTFPLYIQGQPVWLGLLRAGLAVVLLGFLGRVAGDFGWLDSGGVALGVLATGLTLMIAGVRIFDRRRQLPRRPVRPLRDARQVAIISAYGWLSVLVVLLIRDGIGLGNLPRDLELHLLGAGFITLLIFGVGAHLLPGFGRTKMRSEPVAWATATLGNLAVVLRLLPHVIDGSGGDSAAALAGGVGMAAVMLFAWNVGLLGQSDRASSGSTSRKTG